MLIDAFTLVYLEYLPNSINTQWRNPVDLIKIDIRIVIVFSG